MPAYNYNTGFYNPPPRNFYEPVYVIGIEGANAFQMPPGVDRMILWDANNDSFYIKKLDEMGRPKVVAWKDFSDHVEAPKPEPEVAAQPDTSSFVTKEYFDKVINELFVGDRGKVVRIVEQPT